MSTKVIGHKIGDVKQTGITFWIGMISTDNKSFRIDKGEVVLTDLSSNQKLPALSFKVKKLGGTKKPYTRDFRVSASNLSPSTEYSYTISVKGGPLTSDYTSSGIFRTAHAPTDKKPVKILVSSCMMAKENKSSNIDKKDDEQKAWVTINQDHPNLALSLILGDTIYDDSYYRRAKWKYTKAQFAVKYKRQKGFQKHLANTPVYAIYDDHDFIDNDKFGAGNAAITPKKEPRRKRAARYFRQLWVVPKIPGYDSKSTGCFQKIEYGMVDIFILDTRYYREPLGRGSKKYGESGKAPIEILDNRKTLSLLGSTGRVLKRKRKGKYERSSVRIGNEQWEWLNQEFEKYKNSPGGMDRIKLIAYSSPISKGEAKLEDYNDELSSLKALLRPHKNVLLLAGSTHKLQHICHSDFLMPGKDIYEVISSGIGKKKGGPAGGYAIVEVYPGGKEEISVTYYNPDGTVFKQPKSISVQTA